MTQVMSKTSWGLPKVHLRTYNRSLGGLVVKWECAERVKVTQNNFKKIFTSFSGGHNFVESCLIFNFFIDSKNWGPYLPESVKKLKIGPLWEAWEPKQKRCAANQGSQSAEKLKSAIFQGISLKLGPVGIFIIRNWYQNHFWCFGWFRLT